MKTFLTLLLATVFTTSAFAYNEAKLTLTVAVKSGVRIVIDGRTYNQQDATIVLNDIRPGSHSIKIYKTKKGANERGRADRYDRNELLYSANIQVKPEHHVDIMVNRFGKALIDERALRNNRWEDDWDNDDRTNDGYDNNYSRAMTESEFNGFVSHVKRQWFGGKLKAARSGLEQNYFTAAQVKTVLQIFSTDSDKLELAKLAYRNTVDQRAFYPVDEVFSFQSSRDELQEYIRTYRK